VEAREEIALARLVERAETRHPLLTTISLPEVAKIAHLRPGEDYAETATIAPGGLRRAQQFDGPLLDAVISQVSDDDLAGRRPPRKPGAPAVASGAGIPVHAHALEDEFLGRDAVSEQGAALHVRLHEDARGGVQHRGEGRRQVRPTRAVARVIG